MSARTAELVYRQLLAFTDTMEGLRLGAIALYVEGFLHIEGEFGSPVIEASFAEYIDQGDDGFAVELCGAGLWERITDDFGTTVAYRMVTP